MPTYTVALWPDGVLHPLDTLGAAFGDYVGDAARRGPGRCGRYAAPENDLFGAQPFVGQHGAQADAPVADHGDGGALGDPGRERAVVTSGRRRRTG